MTVAHLLHLCDSLFPAGGFAHSDGLEAATAGGDVASAGDLRQWMDVVLDESLGRSEAMTMLLAWRAWTDREAAPQRRAVLDAIDGEAHALRPSSTARAASRAMGARLLKTWSETHPEHAVPVGARFTLPVAFGCVSASARIEARAAAEGFIYTRLAATVSSAMRLMPIGQTDAHTLLARTLARVPATLDAIDGRLSRGERPGAFMPACDVATMAQQHLRSRLFLS